VATALLGASSSVAEPAAAPEPPSPEAQVAADAPASESVAARDDDSLDALSAELDAGQPDPFECVNRKVFGFNRGVDAVLLDPMMRAYAFVMPDLARQSVRNVFANLNTPAALVNDLLQLEAKDAFVTTARFVINTTMGMGGLFDAASTMGLEAHRADFSETLAAAGIPSGPYLIMPLLGPTTVRDGFGSLVDLAMAPQFYVLPLFGFVLVTGSHGMTEREEHFEGMAALEESSIDYYASLRSAYFDSRK
jgi:phospholipid-binding lipoprotein MlaA